MFYTYLVYPPLKEKDVQLSRNETPLSSSTASRRDSMSCAMRSDLQYVANKAMKAAARLTAASASWLSRRLPPADLLQTSCRPPADLLQTCTS